MMKKENMRVLNLMCPQCLAARLVQCREAKNSYGPPLEGYSAPRRLSAITQIRFNSLLDVLR